MRNNARFFRAAVTVLIACAVRSAAAQTAAPVLPAQPAAGTASAKPPPRPATLAEYLPLLDWNPAERGALLVVDPKRAALVTVPTPSALATQNVRAPDSDDPLPTDDNASRLSVITPRYHRRVVVCGALTAVVPETMAVLHYKDLPPPDLLAGVPARNRSELLLSTLSAAQWARLASTEGIGEGDLARDQKPIFAGIFAGGIKLMRCDPAKPNEPTDATATLSDAASAGQIRLRLYQDFQWQFAWGGKNENGVLGIGEGDENGKTEPYYSLQFLYTRPVPFPDEAADGDGMSSNAPEAFGVSLRDAVPNRSKPSDLDYDTGTLNAAVRLSGAATVGDLVARVRTATGIEMFADPRYASLPVVVRAAPGATVRAGDLLKALTLSVTGTFRRVVDGSDAAFVMTDDRVGYGVRLAAIGEWLGDAERRLTEAKQQLRTEMRDADVLDKLRWGVAGGDTPSEALRRRLAAPPTDMNTPVVDRLTPLSELPPSVQARVRAQQDYWHQQVARDPNREPRQIREDGVILSSRTRLSLIIPGAGAVLINGDADISPAPPTEPIPPVADSPSRGREAVNLTPPDETAVLPVRVPADRFPKRLLAVSVRTADDARKAAQVAEAHGFTALLLCTADGSPETLAPLLAAAAGAAPRFALYAQVIPFRGKRTPPELYDRRLFGETYDQSLRHAVPVENQRFGARAKDDTDPYASAGDYVAVGDKGALDAMRNRLRALARSAPHLAGIVIADARPPGYAGTEPFSDHPRTSPYRQLGYTPASRLAFLREAGADPEDLSPMTDSGSMFGFGGNIPYQSPRLTLPFFPDLGPNVANLIINGRKATDMGAKDLYPRWDDFRHKRLLAATTSLLAALHAEKPGIELVARGAGTERSLEVWRDETDKASPQGAASPEWVLLAYSPAPPGSPPMKPAERFARQIAQPLGWLASPPQLVSGANTAPAPSGCLFFDLSAAPLGNVEGLLKNVVVTKTATEGADGKQ